MIFRTNSRHCLAFLALLLACLLLVVSCGKREWPQPLGSEDKFRWRTVKVARTQDCLIVDCEATGAWQNIDTVKLSIEPLGTGPGDGCATCPFTPREIRAYTSGAPGLRQDMNRIVLTACGLDPKKTYRLQVSGFNIHASFEAAVSEIVQTAPQ